MLARELLQLNSLVLSKLAMTPSKVVCAAEVHEAFLLGGLVIERRAVCRTLKKMVKLGYIETVGQGKRRGQWGTPQHPTRLYRLSNVGYTEANARRSLLDKWLNTPLPDEQFFQPSEALVDPEMQPLTTSGGGWE